MARIRYVSRGVAATVAVVADAAGLTVGRAASGAEGSAAAGNAPPAGTRIDGITTATGSEFWQTMPAGSDKAGHDLGVDLVLFWPTAWTRPSPPRTAPGWSTASASPAPCRR